MSRPDSFGPAGDIHEYTAADWAGDLDLVAVFNGPCRRVEVITAGSASLVVETAGSAGASRTLTVYDKWKCDLQITKILAATNITKIQVSA